jgi:outer membrane lipoprotein carrier protein
MKKSLFFLFFTAIVLAQTPLDVAQRAENTLKSYKALQADFVHLFYSSSVAEPLEEYGKCYFQKPSLMKWHYEKPEEKIYLLKDQVIESYFPEDQQLIRSTFKEDEESEILALLAGRQGILENYSVEFSPFPTDNEDALQIKLTPKENGDGSYILLEIDGRNWHVLKAVFLDWAGNKSEFRFSRIRINPSLPKKTFEINVPPGTEIIEDIKDDQNLFLW